MRRTKCHETENYDGQYALRSVQWECEAECHDWSYKEGLMRSEGSRGKRFEIEQGSKKYCSWVVRSSDER